MPLALVALRTEGLDPANDDLLEIAVARVDPHEAQPTDVYTARVRSLHGGRRHHGDSAVWLVDAMDEVRALTGGCVLAAWDAGVTRNFLDAACYHWELLPLDLAPASIDLRSLAWPVAVAAGAGGDTLEGVCASLRIEFAADRCALEDLRALAEVYRRVVRHAASLAGFNADERSIIDTIASRIADGRRTYGPWQVDDGRNNPREALAEVMDALNYCAAELVRLSKGGAE